MLWTSPGDPAFISFGCIYPEGGLLDKPSPCNSMLKQNSSLLPGGRQRSNWKAAGLGCHRIEMCRGPQSPFCAHMRKALWVKSLPQPALLVRSRPRSSTEPVKATRSQPHTGMGIHTAADTAGLWHPRARSRGVADPRAEIHCSVEMPLPLPWWPYSHTTTVVLEGFHGPSCCDFFPFPKWR